MVEQTFGPLLKRSWVVAQSLPSYIFVVLVSWNDVNWLQTRVEVVGGENMEVSKTYKKQRIIRNEDLKNGLGPSYKKVIRNNRKKKEEATDQ